MKELVIEEVKLHLKKKRMLTVSFRRHLEREGARVSYVMHAERRRLSVSGSQGLRHMILLTFEDPETRAKRGRAIRFATLP